MIIGLIGRKRAGKNLTAHLINKHSNRKFKERAFAYDLKKIASILTDFDAQTEEFKETYLCHWNISGREFLTKISFYLRCFNRNIFIKSLMRRYNDEDWIITDVRYPNEVKVIKKYNGITVKIIRPSKMPSWFKKITHIGDDESEYSLDRYKADYAIIAETAEELENEVIKLVKILGI